MRRFNNFRKSIFREEDKNFRFNKYILFTLIRKQEKFIQIIYENILLRDTG